MNKQCSSTRTKKDGEEEEEHALSLLRETELPVKEIAYACGIAYVSYFCRLIRKNTGMTPAEYRRRSTMD